MSDKHEFTMLPGAEPIAARIDVVGGEKVGPVGASQQASVVRPYDPVFVVAGKTLGRPRGAFIQSVGSSATAAARPNATDAVVGAHGAQYEVVRAGLEYPLVVMGADYPLVGLGGPSPQGALVAGGCAVDAAQKESAVLGVRPALVVGGAVQSPRYVVPQPRWRTAKVAKQDSGCGCAAGPPLASQSPTRIGGQAGVWRAAFQQPQRTALPAPMAPFADITPTADFGSTPIGPVHGIEVTSPRTVCFTRILEPANYCSVLRALFIMRMTAGGFLGHFSTPAPDSIDPLDVYLPDGATPRFRDPYLSSPSRVECYRIRISDQLNVHPVGGDISHPGGVPIPNLGLYLGLDNVGTRTTLPAGNFRRYVRRRGIDGMIETHEEGVWLPELTVEMFCTPWPGLEWRPEWSLEGPGLCLDAYVDMSFFMGLLTTPDPLTMCTLTTVGPNTLTRLIDGPAVESEECHTEPSGSLGFSGGGRSFDLPGDLAIPPGIRPGGDPRSR